MYIKPEIRPGENGHLLDQNRKTFDFYTLLNELEAEMNKDTAQVTSKQTNTTNNNRVTGELFDRAKAATKNALNNSELRKKIEDGIMEKASKGENTYTVSLDYNENVVKATFEWLTSQGFTVIDVSDSRGTASKTALKVSW
jgi:hypothetical protein